MKTIAAAFAFAVAGITAPLAASQDATTPPSTEQIRASFRQVVELCMQSVRGRQHFEQMPEAADLIRKSPVARPAPPPGMGPKPPAFDKHWHVPGMPVSVVQAESSCSVALVAKPYGAAQAADLSGEVQPAMDHVMALLPGATELPYYASQDVASGKRFAATDGARLIPLHVTVRAWGDVLVAVNEVPYAAAALSAAFADFENTCLRPLYMGLPGEPRPWDLPSADSGLQTESDFVFYGENGRPRAGYNASDPKTCAYHYPKVSLADAKRLIPAEQWGLAISLAAASKGGVIAIARAP